MKSDELHAIQAPLKEKYKERPALTLITLKAQGRLSKSITCKIDTKPFNTLPIFKLLIQSHKDNHVEVLLC
jgi:hypothetical protein